MKKDLESFGTMLYYSMDKRHFTFVQIRLEFKKKLSYSKLESAFYKTCKRFPYFLVTFAEEENCLITVPNTDTPKLHQDELDYVIDYKDNDGFLFRVSTKDRFLTFSWFHGLTDGAGVFNFLKVLLTQYYKNCGEDIVPAPDVFDINGTPSEEEYSEPLSLVQDVENPYNMPNDLYFSIPGKKTRNLQSYTFSLDQKKLMEYAAKNGGSPNSISVIAIANAVEKTYSDKIKKPIGVSTAINVKPFFKIPKSHKPCTTLSVFGFTKEHLNMDSKELNGLVRRNILKDASDEFLIPFVAAIKIVFKIMDFMTDIKTKQLMCFNSTTGSAATVSESYVGAVPLGSFDKYIKNIYTVVEAAMPLVEINYLNGKFYYSISSKIEIDDLVKNLHDYFDELGFKCSKIEHKEYNTYPGKTDFPKLGLNLTTLKMMRAVKKYKKSRLPEKSDKRQ